LNPLWYLGALGIGIAAGKLGDPWSLGFLAETERQVEAHLDHHLRELPSSGQQVTRHRRRKCDSTRLRTQKPPCAWAPRELSLPTMLIMKLASRTMTRTAYYV
jgi:ubiquinone biosynthesis monooxygenase Coq7